MSIEWDKVLPSVIGALTGGTMSLLGSYFSARRQAKKEENRRKYEEKKAEKLALNSVKNEIEHNYIRYNHFKDFMDNRKMPTFNFKTYGSGIGLKIDRWDKHSDTIESIENIEYLGKLRALYMNIHADLTINIIELERLDSTIEMAKEMRDELNKTIKNNYK
ncbi:hypothetical protein P5815_03025 [Bacillus cereus]|uniref:hypothetical protein n=1 Tax=Bacillus TaxID=1386 RepID=UPI000BFA2924|nr:MULTISPECIES: hypothetical protein [Bacillus cereus group]MBJ7951402.1 hypothetical protein [Bacillus cereus]MBX9155622.1 hypothetical protein [Bacillus cereus]MDF9519545.1 hypothetical protein [Bacillus cereus]MDF9564958.1 hypothetical protein [Bacillus cereus]MDZ4452963.1 hypothetical protein [Bacillus cereus]